MNFEAAHADETAEIRDRINRGNALLARRQFQEAIAEYEAVLDIQPGYSIAKSNIALTHNNWGIFLYSQRKYAEAKEHWETALKLNPRDGHVIRNLKIVENAMAKDPQPQQTQPNPKPKSPQDWNPFDESLDNIQKKETNAGSDAPPAAVASPTVNSTNGTSAASTANRNAAPSAVSNTSTNQTSGPIIILGGTSPSNPPPGSGTATTSRSGGASTVSPPQTNSTRNASPVSSEDPFSSPSSEPSPPSSRPDFNTVESSPNSVRIVGGTSGGATIVGGSTVSGGGKTFTPATTITTSPPSFVPAKVPPAPVGGSTPMSWPGGNDERAPMLGKPNRDPNFLENNNRQEEPPPQDDSLNVENLLEQIEVKLYGKVSKNQPVLKRIEKLEVDTLGKKRSGPVAGRLKELKETYGL
jgi:Tfp pilus assembly protein PilF